MSRRHLPIPELVAAVVVAGLILLLSPGVAVAGLVAMGVLLICGLTLAVGRRRARRRQLDARPRPQPLEDRAGAEERLPTAAERERSPVDRARAAAERQREREARGVSGRRR